MNLRGNWNNLKKMEVVVNLSKLSLGTVGAQIIPFLFSPLIARMYDAEEYGRFAALLAIVNIIAVVVNGRYDLTVILPKMRSKARSLLMSSWIAALLTSILSGVLLLLFSEHISNLLKITLSGFEIGLISISLFLVGLWQPMNYYFIRNKWFSSIAWNKITQTSFNTLATLFFGAISVSMGLFYGYIFGWLLLVIFTFYQAFRNGFIMPRMDLIKIREISKEYIDYPKFNALPAILNSIASQLGVYVFIFHFNEEISGYYSFSKLYVYVPLSIIGTSLAQIYFQRISEKYAKKEGVLKELKVLLLILSACGVSAIIFIELFADFLFDLIFGKQWLVAAEYSKILILYFVIQFIVSPMSTILNAVNRVKLASIFPVVYLGAMLGLFLLKPMDVNSFLTYYVLAESGPYIVYFSLIMYAVLHYEGSIKEKTIN